MGLLGKFRQSPLFRTKQRKHAGGHDVLTVLTFDAAEKESSIILSTDEFDLLFAERNVKGLVPLCQIREEESAMRNSEDALLLAQVRSLKKTTFPALDKKVYHVNAQKDITSEHEPHQFSHWHQDDSSESDDVEGLRTLRAEIANTTLSMVEAGVAMACDSKINTRTSETLLHRKGIPFSRNLGHKFIGELPTLYEDEAGQSTSNGSDNGETTSKFKLVQKEGESNIRARWDYALECMSRMGQCVEDTTSRSAFIASPSFIMPPTHPSTYVNFRTYEVEFAEI